jgi:prepilin-type N-terminal cleavage/methylation domain-containing protein
MNKRNEQGFTLIETLVAITVLLLAIAAPLTLASQGLTASRIARDQVTATYLMQEAIEHIRNTRDTNVLTGDSWFTGLDACLAGTCSIDVPQAEIDACVGACAVMRYNDSLGLYGYGEGSGWEDTKFTRTVSMEETIAGVEAEITVTVSWADGLAGRSVEMQEHLLNWQ